jgi:glyoxylase-like metal-dependent hydrolase (beta-lactamase superfamily II)
MTTRKAWLVALLPLALAPAPAAAQEAAALLKRAAAAMGADRLTTLRYSGSGGGASYGQAYRPGMPWPRLNYSSYERQLDYQAQASSEIVVRSRAEPRGGGAVPLAGEARFGALVSGAYAWNLAGPAPVPRQAARGARLHDLWITPHGVIKAAQRGDARLAFRTVRGRELAAVSFAVPGIMSATALINEDYLVERVESRVPDPVLGDTAVVTRYSDYRDFGGVKFPTRIRQTQAGAAVLDLEVKEVAPNARVELAVPENVRTATERVSAEQAAEGVWFLGGGSHNSVLIEMKDHAILVEAPLYDGRVGAVLDTARKLAPGKRVRYVVNSHSHFDHSGGLRAAAAAGAAVITQQANKAFFEKAFANPNRIAPDLLARSGNKAKVIGVAGKRVLSDGSRTVEIHKLPDRLHTDTFLMVYLPKEKLLIEADAFTPGPPNQAAPAKPNPYHVNLLDHLARLKLEPERILPLHGRMVPVGELKRVAAR